MAYEKNLWVDQQVERPKTYEMTNNSDGSVTLIDSFGLVTELGTPVNADNMNHIEEGIEEHENRITTLENLPDSYLKKNQITNCITEIPQRIKYTLENGTLTIKAGSVVIVPYGTEDLSATYPVGATFLNENFKVYDTQFADGKFFVWAELQIDLSQSSTDDIFDLMPQISFNSTLNELTLNAHYVNNYASGEAPPTDFKVYYNTLTNILKPTTQPERIYSFPIMLTTGAFTSTKQVFNGIGYIGSTIWVDKGVKGLIPNGRNEDGTLRNVEITTNKLATNNAYNNAKYCGVNYLGVPYFADQTYYYNKIENRNVQNNLNWDTFVIAELSVTNGQITSFNPKQTFRAVDYNDKYKITSWPLPSNKFTQITMGTSGSTYTAPDNGYFVVSGLSGSNNGYVDMRNKTCGELGVLSNAYSTNMGLRSFVPAKKGDVIIISYTTNFGANSSKFLIFVFAEGSL